MEKAAKRLKDQALQDLQAEIAEGLWGPEKTEGEVHTYRFDGFTLTRGFTTRESISSKGKERIEELKGDLRQDGLITNSTKETWTTRLSR